MSNVLVTGGAGFIGSHLCESLLGKGHKVTCLDNFSTGSWDNISHLSGLRVIEGDVNQVREVDLIGKDKFDVVFHYAAVVGVQRTEENPYLVLEDVRGIRNVGELALRGKVGKVVFASSSEVYGNIEKIPMDEGDGVMAWNPYSTVKIYGEHFYSSLWKYHDIPTVSLRFFNVYGPRQSGSSYGFVVSRFIEQVRSGEGPTVHGGGLQTRDFVYIDDNIRAALAVMDRERVRGQVINVGSGRETSVVNLAKLIAKTASVEDLGVNPVFVKGRPNDVRRRCASTKKMEELLGCSCKITLEEGISMIVKVMTEEERRQRLELSGVAV